MAGWHHWLDGLESEWTPGVGDGQGGLACCDSWGRKESDTTERLIWSDIKQGSLRTIHSSSYNKNTYDTVRKTNASIFKQIYLLHILELVICWQLYKGLTDKSHVINRRAENVYPKREENSE